MSEAVPIAYLEGRYIPVAEAKLSVFDLGLYGVAVSEVLRTFRGRLFQIEDHLQRLAQSLDLVGIIPDESPAALRGAVEEVAGRNAALIDRDDDLGVVILITGGMHPGQTHFAEDSHPGSATACVYSYRLPFKLWAERYQHGLHLVTTGIRAIPPGAIDPRIKSRSRLHWHLADREARQVDPCAAALLLDDRGRITETSTANIHVVIDGGICTPPSGAALAGVSQRVLRELAEQLDVSYREVPLRPQDVQNAAEAISSSTPYCLLPVTLFNNHSIGDGRPGPVFRALMEAWNQLVELDIIAQAESRVSGDVT